jgi:hypothetical protein
MRSSKVIIKTGYSIICQLSHESGIPGFTRENRRSVWRCRARGSEGHPRGRVTRCIGASPPISQTSFRAIVRLIFYTMSVEVVHFQRVAILKTA